jgi:hypothetical protein
MANSSQRINSIISGRNFKSYLEIGVQQGNTFREILAPYKVAVDPKFLFEYCNDDVNQFNEMTSDAFFCQRSHVHFDFVFIDGLHTFQQTLRDFLSTLIVTDNRSVILIDDVVPSDVYSAIPDFSECLKSREFATKNNSAAWHGDVFKLVFFINDFFPNLSFYTVNPKFGNPQTFVIRRPREQFKPVFNCLEDIERLSYFDFLNRYSHIFNFVDENEILNLVINN